MDNILEIGKACCGCRACEQSCPTNAIFFDEDSEGFLQPLVDQEKCITCGKCLKVCPINSINVFHANQLGYAAKTKNLSDIKKCSSGGLFFELAKNIIEQGGVVCGCSLDDSLMPVHIIATSIEEAKLLRGSKYVQSNIGNIYTKIKQYLEKGVTVLFTGVPCQVAGLRNFLIKDYPQLYCLDIICHGVPSRKMYASYLKWLENKYGEKLVSVDFRSKKKHQWSLTLSIKSKAENGRIREHLKIASLDPYYYNFLQGNTYRESCYTCPYSQSHRVGDITIGDFWGIEKCYPELFDIKGVSCAIVNSKKGVEMWSNILDRIDSNEVLLSNIINNNGNLNKPTERKSIRDIVYLKLNREGFKGVPYLLPRKNYIIDSVKNYIPNNWRFKVKRMLGLIH